MTVVFQASDHESIASRLERWRHVVDETFGPALLRPPSRTHVPQQLVVGDVGAVRVSELRIAYPTPSSDRCQAARTPRLIRQSDPERYRVDLPARGNMVVEQAGREAALEAGDFTVVDWSRPARWATASERAVSLMFPRALLALPHDAVARLGGVRISGRHGAGALFSSFARQVVAHLDDYGAADGARLGTAIVDLLTAALAARLDAEDEAPAGSRQEALRRRVHVFIEQRLADPTLSPAVVADAHHVSLRYLYKLFEGRDSGVAGWIRERRLERSRRDLLDPALAARPVSAIAARGTGRPGPLQPAVPRGLRRPAAGVPQDHGQNFQTQVGDRARIDNRRARAANDTRSRPGKTGIDADDPNGRSHHDHDQAGHAGAPVRPGPGAGPGHHPDHRGRDRRSP